MLYLDLDIKITFVFYHFHGIFYINYWTFGDILLVTFR